MTRLLTVDEMQRLSILAGGAALTTDGAMPVAPDEILSKEERKLKQLFYTLVEEGWLEEVRKDHFKPTQQTRDNMKTIQGLLKKLDRR